MTPAEKKELVGFLKRGDKKQICKLAGVHETVMYAWISGRLKSSSIEPYVIQLANQRKKEFEEQTGESIQEHFIDSEIIIHENLKLKAELELSQKDIRKYRKLISGKNRIYQQLFSGMKNYLKETGPKHFQQNVLLEKLEQFQADFSFLNHYEKYADILNSVNPLFSKSLDALNSDISMNEKELLSMFKLNLSNHEIALILVVSDDTVEERSHVLKQKLKLDPEQSLSDFVNSL